MDLLEKVKQLEQTHKSHNRGHDMRIIINGRTEEVPDGIHVLAYENIVAIAGYDPKRILTVVYSKKVREGFLDGSVAPGGAVIVAEGMIINVADTSNA